MILPKRLINLIGMIVVVALVAAGVFLVALPVYLGVVDVDAQQRQVADSNNLQRIQIASLAEAQNHLDDLKSDLAGLQEQLPQSPQLDQVSELAVTSASSTGVEPRSIEVGDTTDFTPPTGVLADGEKAPAPTPSASGDTASGDAGSGDTTAAGSSGTTSQIAVTIVVNAANPAKVADFIDALRQGPRLLQVSQVVTKPSETANGSQLEATISAFAFTHPS